MRKNLLLNSAAALLAAALVQAVPNGATAIEVARTGPSGTMFRVTLPQAFRVSLPPLGNEFASVIKDTSLLNIIGWLDLAQIGLLQVPAALKADFNLVFIIWIEIAMLYFVLTFVVTKAVRFVENAYKVPGLEAAEL